MEQRLTSVDHINEISQPQKSGNENIFFPTPLYFEIKQKYIQEEKRTVIVQL